MTREFKDLASFATHLAQQSVKAELMLHEGLDRAAAVIEREAKREFGVYQPQTGPFQEWPELAESTQEERERLGFTPNDPLLRDGQTLRASVSREVHRLDAVVGSTSDIMIYQEFGTSRMPARPVFGPAWYRHREEVGSLVAQGAMLGIMGGRTFGFAELKSGGQVPVHESLGYDFATEGQ